MNAKLSGVLSLVLIVCHGVVGLDGSIEARRARTDSPRDLRVDNFYLRSESERLSGVLLRCWT